MRDCVCRFTQCGQWLQHTTYPRYDEATSCGRDKLYMRNIHVMCEYHNRSHELFATIELVQCCEN